MTSIIKYNDGVFPNLYCNQLIITPITTDLKWNTEKKNPYVLILGFIDIAKTINNDEEIGIIANTGFNVGTDSKRWYYDILATCPLNVGMALSTQKFNTSEGVAVNSILNVIDGDKVRFTLTPAGVYTIRHENGNGLVQSNNTYTLDNFIGKTLYPWVSSVLNSTMSLKIMYDIKFNITVGQNGATRMNGLRNNIVDFSLKNIIDNNGSNINFGGGGDSISNNSGSAVMVADNGNITLNGGVSYKKEDITESVISITLSSDQCIVVISNPTIRDVYLPLAGSNPCKYYQIIRNYSIQPGESWRLSRLNIHPVYQDIDNIDGKNVLGIPVDANIKVISDGIRTWKIM